MKKNTTRTLRLLLLILCSISYQAQAQTWDFAQVIGPANSSSESQINDFLSDSDGNMYICGSFQDTVTLGGEVIVPRGIQDLFVAKLDTSGEAIWVLTGGGFSTSPRLNNDIAYELLMDAQGDLYVTGEFKSNNTIFFGDTSFVKSSIYNMVFIAKVSSSGETDWLRPINGILDGLSRHPKMAFDTQGNLFFAGNFKNTISFGNDTLNYPNEQEIFISSIDPDGTVNYLSYADGTGWVDDFEINEQNEFIFTGKYSSSPTVIGDSVFILAPGTEAGFIYKLDQQRNFAWAKRVESLHSAIFHEIETDPLGNIYAFLMFRESVSIEDTTLLPTCSTFRCGLLMKLTANGDLEWVNSGPDILSFMSVTYTPETKLIGWGEFGRSSQLKFRRFSEDGNLIQTFNVAAVSVFVDHVRMDEKTHTAYLTGSSGTFSVFGSDTIQAGIHNNTRGLWAILSGLDIRTTSEIKGSLVSDVNANCKRDPNEISIAGRLLEAKRTNQSGVFYTKSDDQGNYTFYLPEGDYTVEQIIPELSPYIQTYCPPTNEHSLSLGSIGRDTSGLDFYNQEIQCAFLQVSVNSNRRRYCARNQTVIQYCNQGNQTQNNVEVHVRFPEFVIPIASTIPWTLNTDSSYTFSIGSLAPNTCGSINITDSVRCAGVFLQGLAQCTEAWITPLNTCFLDDPNWNKASLEVEGTCENRTNIHFTIRNTGTGGMTDSSEYRIFMDSLLVHIGKVQLNANEEFHINFPSNGATFRVEADQVPHHPQNSWVAAVVEACANTQTITSISKGFVTMFAPRDPELQISTECLPIIGSFDPNDKQGLPVGIQVNTEYFIKAGSTINYKIRFQNTGTDTAFKIVIIDTLSTNLDISSLQIQGASHPFQVNVSGQGNPILHFVFDPIALPDSNVNEPASNGFVSFSISGYHTLANSSTISNFADIYFDQNPPVRTNTTLHTIGDFLPQDLGILDSLSTEYITDLSAGEFTNLKVYPNPNRGHFTLTWGEALTTENLTIKIYTSTGNLIWADKRAIISNDLEIDIPNLSPGHYFLRLGEYIYKKLVIIED